jgi:hypothetical protein
MSLSLSHAPQPPAKETDALIGELVSGLNALRVAGILVDTFSESEVGEAKITGKHCCHVFVEKLTCEMIIVKVGMKSEIKFLAGLCRTLPDKMISDTGKRECEQAIRTDLPQSLRFSFLLVFLSETR